MPDFFAGKRVLDVACGTGSWTERISWSAESVIGIDINPEMLEIARRRSDLDRAKFAIADAYCLSEEIGVFGAAFVGFLVFSHSPLTHSAILYKSPPAPAPGSIVLVVDNKDTLCRTIPISDRDDEGTFQMRCIVDGTSFRVLKNFPTEAELVAATAPFGVKPIFRKLEHFWTLKYQSKASLQDVGSSSNESDEPR